ncbi:uncharacterized protein LOC122083983 [Macadamia integrifolia]|uniref:uncharacterized protein LOC122083983 n=1 Tax=Macadamia integrifolia TaxID=60698 RepID=UPI001C4F6F89|nr:uncharacterized protein LOC122083983 [Macadamia integrifolia]XP_042507884.1 uncharacterized protein LOC122083983 [Macadamia integrifolia]XP_042507885.1 uncharacterized protein LOC122083983 [Macadamia integrifolia]XP_042507886.1 uncharacterized protein LOC122083983 [Macadamia integrifolia]XP_042507887.1 uncharacterized protein LOC122083983 [Macadamia integrifolia]
MEAIAESPKHQKRDNGEYYWKTAGEEEETWSVLPDHLLWMIRERLNFVQNLYVAAVCKNWWSASPTCSNITTTRFSLPWIMGYRGHDSTEQEFIDPWYRKKYVSNLPDLSGARVIYSKEGWLLVLKTIGVENRMGPTLTRTKSIEGSKECSPFLLNPLTKAKIELPKLPYAYVLAGTFSIIDGAIGHVAFAAYDDGVIFPSSGDSDSPNLFIANLRDRSGDDETSWMWFKYTPSFGVGNIDRVVGFLIIGALLYLFDAKAGMFVFDLLTLAWKEYRRFGNVDIFSYILECEGEIIDMHMNEWRDGFRFFKLNLNDSSDSEVDWVELKDDDVLIQDRVWFTGQRSSSSFTRKVKLDEGSSMKKIVYHNRVIFQQDYRAAKWIFSKVEFDGLEKSGVYVDQKHHYLPLWVDIS